MAYKIKTKKTRTLYVASPLYKKATAENTKIFKSKKKAFQYALENPQKPILVQEVTETYRELEKK